MKRQGPTSNYVSCLPIWRVVNALAAARQAVALFHRLILIEPITSKTTGTRMVSMSLM
jgi:hypothetical protein